MRFHCHTDTEKRIITPLPETLTQPFYAKKDWETLVKLISCWNQMQSVFPVNPKFPSLPQMPEKVNDCATYLFTSGSTSSPKIACLSFENYRFSAEGSIHATRLEKNDRWLLSLPLYHVGGLAILFRCMLADAIVVLSDYPLLDAILAHQITHLSIVPTQLYRLLLEDQKKLEKAAKQLKIVLLGGAPVSELLLKQGKEAGLPLHPTYGLTEMCSQVTMDPLPGSLPYREIKFAEDGEILVKGKTLFMGYYNFPLELDHGGWFATKDLGKWRPDGTLQVLGRKDLLFISGGENIQPEEIETALLNLEGIYEAIVVPKEDPEFGMRPFAFIQTKLTKDYFKSIQEQLKKTLPSYKIPVGIAFLPENSTLKRNRSELCKLVQMLN